MQVSESVYNKVISSRVDISCKMDDKRRVIAFSLWGDNPKYTLGMVENAKLAPVVYPGWEVWVYAGTSVPTQIVTQLVDLSARVIAMPEGGNWKGMFWRFEAMCDTSLDVVISRDADSRLSMREQRAVDDFIESRLPIHIMRDHPWHTAVILGGMWGIRPLKFPQLGTLLQTHRHEQGDYWQTDQQFLARHVYPAIHPALRFVHDEFHRYDGFRARPFPLPRVGDEFVGSVYDPITNLPDSTHASVLRRALLSTTGPPTRS